MPASALLAAASIASLNLCTDEYLLLLARPREIASVSFLSQDPRESPLWKLAKRHHSNRGSLEQVLARKPDTVLTMGGGGRASSLIARRLRMRAIDLRPVGAIDDVAFNLNVVAAALGDPGRAQPWLERLSALKASRPKQAEGAIWVGGGGQSIGVPSVGADWMRLAGLQQRALSGGRVSLEDFLVRPPAVLVQSRYRSGQMSRGTAWLNHPILRNAKSRHLQVDGRAWTCMGPLVIPEIEQLKAARR
jgi:iron complex transport system substrate-binding protein